MRLARWSFALSILALAAVEILRIYWIMPFPGSQGGGTLAWAYLLHRAIWPLRVALGAVAAWGAWRLLAAGRWGARFGTALPVAAFGALAWQANGPMSADVMFRQPIDLRFEPVAGSSLSPRALVLGVAEPDDAGRVEARAYPVRFIGYHHQVRDVVAGKPVLVTYCTVCRTGRIFRPIVDGEPDRFRLVGMDQWNAMFEDSRTGSWWRQATGEAVAGPLRGRRLEEVASRQMSWAAWTALHPATTVMEPDPEFADRYAALDGFEEGTRPGRLTGRDPSSWRDKSWVVGVLVGDAARAFDWNELVRERTIRDRVGETPIVLTLGADGVSFYAFDARVEGLAQALQLTPAAEPGRFVDGASGSIWSAEGLGLEGPRAGARLAPLRAYQEFWHSWRTFRPETTARNGPARG